MIEPRVFALDEIKFPLRPIFEFGEVIYLFGKGERRPSIFAEDYPSAVIEALQNKNFNTQSDLILLVGSSCGISRLCATAAMYYDGVRGLAYDAKEKRYIPLYIDDFATNNQPNMVHA